jgi:hypothetical protein
MLNLTREHLPLYQKLINPVFDIHELRSWADHLLNTEKFDDINGGKFYDQMVAYRKDLRSWFMTDNELSTSSDVLSGENYKQLNLTDFDSSLSTKLPDSNRNLDSSFSKVRRTVDKDSSLYIPESDEKNYTIPNKHCSDYVKNVVFKSFEGTATRCRLALMRPSFSIKPHIDNNTDYSVRYHIPIYTNKECNFYIRNRKNADYVKFNMLDDGSVWFLNTGYTHYADNKSQTNRLHLIVTCINQNDLTKEINK